MNTRSAGSTRWSLFVVCLWSVGSVTPSGAQTLPRFHDPRPLTNREVALTLAVSNSSLHRVDTATNLPAWSPLWTFPSGATSLQHTDSAAPYLPLRFYRAQQVAGTNALVGDHLATTNGDVLIRPIRHASFVLSWNGKMIYNDPVGAASNYAGLPRADLILVSHTHSDHFLATTIDAVRGSNVVIVAPQAVFNSLSAPLRAFTTILTNGATANVLGLRVDAVPAYNANHARGTGNGYVLTIGGRRLYMSGDTGDTPEMRALPDIDVAFLCMNLPFTMSVTDAASATRAFRPKVVYPYHFQNQDSTFSDLNDFKRRVGQDLGIEVRLRKWY